MSDNQPILAGEYPAKSLFHENPALFSRDASRSVKCVNFGYRFTGPLFLHCPSKRRTASVRFRFR